MIRTSAATSSVLDAAIGTQGTHPLFITASPPAFASTLHTFINPQPISKTSIIRNNPRIVNPYRCKKERDPTFTAVAAKVGGTALGILYEIPPRPPSPRNPLNATLAKSASDAASLSKTAAPTAPSPRKR
jgi:hypothetical protein